MSIVTDRGKTDDDEDANQLVDVEDGKAIMGLLNLRHLDTSGGTTFTTHPVQQADMVLAVPKVPPPLEVDANHSPCDTMSPNDNDLQTTMTYPELKTILHSDGSFDSAVCVNSPRGQKVNKGFYQFLYQKTYFLLKFVIQCNSCRRQEASLKLCAQTLVNEWVEANNKGTTYILEFQKESSVFHVLLTISPKEKSASESSHFRCKISAEVQKKMYRVVSKCCSNLCDIARPYISKFSYGKGVMKQVHAEFRMRDLTETDVVAIKKVSQKEQFHKWIDKMAITKETQWSTPGSTPLPNKYYFTVCQSPSGELVDQTTIQPQPKVPPSTILGSPLKQQTLNFPVISRDAGDTNPHRRTLPVRAAKLANEANDSSLSLNTGYKMSASQRRLAVWSHSLDSRKKKALLEDYLKLEAVYCRLTLLHKVIPPRACWEDVFTAKCCNEPCCWKCRECRKRFCQVTIVLVGAQGTKDLLCLPHFGAVFRHPRYRLFSVEEWSSISISELTMVFSQVSKQAQSAMFVNLFLGDLAFKSDLPQKVSQISLYHGFGKKTACLLLNAMDPNMIVGIPVDRHLATGFKCMGWADPAERDETQISRMVELWLPPEHWSRCNVVCASLRQVSQTQGCHKEMMFATAKALGPAHHQLLEKCCTRDSDSSSKESLSSEPVFN